MRLSRADLEKLERLKVDWLDVTKFTYPNLKSDQQLLSALMQKGWSLPDSRQLLSKVQRSKPIGLKKANRSKRRTGGKAKRNLVQKLNPIARMNSIGRARPIQGGAPGLKSQK